LIHRVSFENWSLPSSPINTSKYITSSFFKIPKEPTFLPDGIMPDIRKTLSFLTIPFSELVRIIPYQMGWGSLTEIGKYGSPYNYHFLHRLTSGERTIGTQVFESVSRQIATRLDTLPKETKIQVPSPKPLFGDKEGLPKLYPETIGLIGVKEAYNRITQIVGDYGSVLYGILGANEYYGLRDTLFAIVKESEGKRNEIREEMAKVQSQLKELEGTLRTLPRVSKHYGSRKEVEKAKGTIPLWDESLDDDPDRFLYYGSRLEKIVGSVLNEMQANGELDLAPSSINDVEMCSTEPLISKIPPVKLEEAIRRDLDKYNTALSEDKQLKGDQYDQIVKRVMLGGRPVENGDVALITRHLRTAAYRWNAERRAWVAIRDDEEVFTGDDVIPNQTATRVFSKTLFLNKQYRLLSKTKDDLELLSRRPDLMMDPEDITRRITELMDSVAEVSERRLAQLKKNRVLDEVAFMFDSIPMLMSRNIPEREESKDEGEGDGEDGMPHGRLTRRQLHKAKMTEELVTDTDLELFEGG
jgi:hypothetical protein